MGKPSHQALGDVAEIVMGQSPAGETCNRQGIGLPLLNGPTEFGPHHPLATQFTVAARKQSQPGDILFCVRGSTTGRMNWSDQVYAIGRGIAAIRHKHNPDIQPLIRSIIEYNLPSLLQAATGSTFPNVSAKQLAEIPYPPLGQEEQRRMASLFGALDEKIDLNRRTNETLEAMARAIFRDWFVDFGPTRAKMEGREPYLAPDLWELFPDRIEDATGLPQGWSLEPSSKLIEFNPTETLRKGTPAPYLDMASLPTSGSVAEPPVVREFGSGMKFRDGDALLARITPCLENGKTAFIQNLGSGVVGWGSTEFIVMRAKPPVPAPVSYLLAREHNFREHAIRSMTGTSGRQRAQADVIAAYPMASPNSPLLWKRLGDVLQSIFDRIGLNAEESRSLAKARDLLLPKLISGEIHLHDAERTAGKIL